VLLQLTDSTHGSVCADRAIKNREAFKACNTLPRVCAAYLTDDTTIRCRTRSGIVHGGMSAMLIDEALGALVYLLKRDGVLGSGVALTAQLEVKYKKVSNTVWRTQ